MNQQAYTVTRSPSVVVLLNFLELLWPFGWTCHPSRARHTPITYSSACNEMPATHVTKNSIISPNEFVLCLQALLRPSSALFPCEFAACMQALMLSPVPAANTRHGSRLGEPTLHASRTIRRFLPDNIRHITTRGYLLLPSPRIIEYSDDILCVSPTKSSVLPACPFPWQYYYNCGCCDCNGCLVHVTVPGSTSGSTGSHSQRSPNSSISKLSSSQMRTTRVSLLRLLTFSFLFLKKKRKTGVASLSYGRWRIS